MKKETEFLKATPSRETEQRREGHSALRGIPTDDNGGAELTVFDPNPQRPAMTEAYAVKEAGYWCVICGRLLPRDDSGVIIHDNIPHPDNMTFDEQDNPQ